MSAQGRNRPRWLAILLLLLYSAALAGGAFFVGRSTAPQREPGFTFYARIVSIDDSRVRVEGLEVNEPNCRGLMEFNVTENTELFWQGRKHHLRELEPGQLVAVTHSGGVVERYPGVLVQVDRVQRLDYNTHYPY